MSLGKNKPQTPPTERVTHAASSHPPPPPLLFPSWPSLPPPPPSASSLSACQDTLSSYACSVKQAQGIKKSQEERGKRKTFFSGCTQALNSGLLLFHPSIKLHRAQHREKLDSVVRHVVYMRPEMQTRTERSFFFLLIALGSVRVEPQTDTQQEVEQAYATGREGPASDLLRPRTPCVSSTGPGGESFR